MRLVYITDTDPSVGQGEQPSYAIPTEHVLFVGERHYPEPRPHGVWVTTIYVKHDRQIGLHMRLANVSALLWPEQIIVDRKEES